MKAQKALEKTPQKTPQRTQQKRGAILLFVANATLRNALADLLVRQPILRVAAARTLAEAKKHLATGEFAVAVLATGDSIRGNGAGGNGAKILRQQKNLQRAGFTGSIVTVGRQEKAMPEAWHVQTPLRPAFLIKALSAALAASARRDKAKITKTGARVLVAGSYRLDTLSGILRGEDGRQLRLTGKEAALLARLWPMAEQTGKEGATRAQLRREVWGHRTDLNTHTLETHLYRLKKKLNGWPALRLISAGTHCRLEIMKGKA